MFVPEQDRQATAADLPHDAILCQVVRTALLLLPSQGELSSPRGCEACQTVQGLTPVGTILQNCGITSLVIEFSAFATLVCIKHATHPVLWDWGTGSYPDLRFGLAITFFRKRLRLLSGSVAFLKIPCLSLFQKLLLPGVTKTVYLVTHLALNLSHHVIYISQLPGEESEVKPSGAQVNYHR